MTQQATTRLQQLIFAAVTFLILAGLPAMALEVAGPTGLRATVYTADEISRDLLEWDDNRLWLRHPEAGDLELATGSPDDRPLVPMSPEVVEAALAAIQGFDADLQVHVFILPAFPAVVTSSFATRNVIYLAPAFGEQSPEIVSYVVAHELGHVLCWASMDGRPARWQEYLDLRGLAPQDDPGSLPHADRNREIVAEDFRALFGGPLATASGTIENGSLVHPDQVSGLRTLLRSFVETATTVIDRVATSSVYPNPCREEARVELMLADAGAKSLPSSVRLEIYDVRGRLVQRLDGGAVVNGRATISWDGRGRDGRRQAGGIYLYRVSAGQEVGSGRLLLLDR